jgi:hypothetical protein
MIAKELQRFAQAGPCVFYEMAQIRTMGPVKLVNSTRTFDFALLECPSI